MIYCRIVSTFKKEMILITQKVEKEGAVPYSFYDASVIKIVKMTNTIQKRKGQYLSYT